MTERAVAAGVAVGLATGVVDEGVVIGLNMKPALVGEVVWEGVASGLLTGGGGEGTAAAVAVGVSVGAAVGTGTAAVGVGTAAVAGAGAGTARGNTHCATIAAKTTLKS